MREIKYRAWSKVLNDFLDITAFEIFKGEINGIFNDGDFIGYDKEDIIMMEYTGLKDKNGKEIYEGDIVSLPNEKPFKDFICVVQFNDGCFDIYNKERNWRDYLKCWTCNYVPVVIGNIYKNPELLG